MNRSPIGLRSQRLSQVTKTNHSTDSNRMQTSNASKMKKATNSIAIKNIDSKKIDQMSEIKNIIANQQQHFDETIERIRTEINGKCAKFTTVIASIEMEIEQIKVIKCECNSKLLQPFWRDTNSNVMIDFLLHGMCIERVEEEYKFQVDEIRKKMEILEKANTNSIEETHEQIDENECECDFEVFGLSICKIHRSNNKLQAADVTSHKHGTFDMDTAIELLQDQIDKVSHYIRSEEENMQNMK